MFPKLEPWQQLVMQGIKAGGGKIVIAARGMGKSMAQEMYRDQSKTRFTVLQSALVDGKMWHTVYCGFAIADWVQQQDANTWTEGFCDPLGMCFDVSEELYVMLVLRWG